MSTLKKILTLLFMLLGLLACSPYSGLSYDELHEELETATAEEKPKVEEAIERFERDAARAEEYFQRRALCHTLDGMAWTCVDPTYSEDRVDKILESNPTADEIVKVYRRQRTSCGCQNINDLLRTL